MEETRELSLIEIRNLMLETLAYEGNDIDTEGKNFKMYGYQGSQGDLFRLMDGLVIKKKQKPKIVNMTGSAWGCHSGLLYENSNTNFSINEILKIYGEFSNLISQSVIAPGAYGSYGTGLPFFHVTEYGHECLKNIDILPYDRDGYLTEIKKIKNLNEWLIFYITEGLNCFNANCINSSVINIGLAGEVIFEELINGLDKYLLTTNPTLHASYISDLSKDRSISKQYDVFANYISQKLKNDPSIVALVKSTIDKSSIIAFGNYTRLTRNSVTHPNEIIMDRTRALLLFISFIGYCKLQYVFIDHFNK